MICRGVSVSTSHNPKPEKSTQGKPKGNPFLEGNYAPVVRELTSTHLRVEGSIPRELNGRFLRNGPNPVGDIDPGKHHWFVGNGMVHGVCLNDGHALWYRNRLVRSPDTSRILGETPIPDPFEGQRRIFAANTNVIGHARHTYALVEAGGCPVELSYELDTVAYSDFDGTLPGAFSAHPKRDPRTGELHTVAYDPHWGNRIQYVCVAPEGHVTKTVDVTTTGAPMVHDTAFTEHYVVLMDLPCVLDLQVAQSGVGLPYRWHRDYPARLGLLHRETSATQWFDIDPCYIFHPANAYEDASGQVVFDAVRHRSMFDRTVLGPDEGRPALHRWQLNPATGRASEQVVDTRAHEFPRHDERREGSASRYLYSTDVDPAGGHMALLKTDLQSGAVTEHRHHGRFHLEGVFIPRTEHSDEDDGWVMAYAWDARENTSAVVIIDANEFKAPPLATIHLPQRVPFGFHGNWIPD
jgi:YD repeat-containing protein